MQYNYEWDPDKERTNIRKHGVTFEDASKIFDDPMALTVFDEEESSEDEDRWVTLGLINGQHYLVVVHTFRSSDDDKAITIRLISARPANKHEVQQYEQG